MMTPPRPSLRGALARFSFRIVLQQLGLALLVFVLAVLWLHVPDASVPDVVGSAVLGCFLLAVAGAGESWLILRLVDRPDKVWRRQFLPVHREGRLRLDRERRHGKRH